MRPALDLLAQVPDVPSGDIVDLGSGTGAVAAALAARWPGRRLVGVDASSAMLAEARATGHYAALIEADAATWTPPVPPALVFSNAALHWLGDHEGLLPRLARLIAPGGALAVQMPLQHDAPSHRLLAEVAGRLFPDLFAPGGRHVSPVRAAADYARLLAPFGAVSAWETEYVQSLPPSGNGHPVRLFTESTAMRPYLARLSPDEAAAFVAAYETALAPVYRAEADGSVLFPFRRVFLVLHLPGSR
ncbi:MAG: methyltransferase domain-containing protein [Rhodobacteraceae bacterium]|nr:methyltransferase domain-containing protein [Paracoccaceae bacterium]